MLESIKSNQLIQQKENERKIILETKAFEKKRYYFMKF